MTDRDPTLRVLACRLCLAAAPQIEKAKAVRQLLGSMDNANWLLFPEIEDCLTTYFGEAREAVETALREAAPDGRPLRKRTRLALQRVQARGEARANAKPHPK